MSRRHWHRCPAPVQPKSFFFVLHHSIRILTGGSAANQLGFPCCGWTSLRHIGRQWPPRLETTDVEVPSPPRGHRLDTTRESGFLSLASYRGMMQRGRRSDSVVQAHMRRLLSKISRCHRMPFSWSTSVEAMSSKRTELAWAYTATALSPMKVLGDTPYDPCLHLSIVCLWTYPSPSSLTYSYYFPPELDGEVGSSLAGIRN